jgi:hypothetical protein
MMTNTKENQMFTQEKLDAFVALFHADHAAYYNRQYPDSKLPVDMAWAAKPGKKFVKVNIGTSGRYMVDLNDGTIYGIKGYGTVHYGHVYGTLDTIHDWFWGEYYGVYLPSIKTNIEAKEMYLSLRQKGDELMAMPITEKVLPKSTETDEVKPEIGMGATVCGYTDKYAGTIVRVTAKRMDVQRDKVTKDPNWRPEVIPGGFVGHCTNQDSQTYTYERDPNGEIYHCSLRTTDAGRNYWRVCGSTRMMVKVGVREEFYDYNF